VAARAGNGAACRRAVLWPVLLRAQYCAQELTSVAGAQQLFVAGPAGGEVHQFQVVAGRPVEIGVLRAPRRVRVLDLAVDEVRGGVWVLSPRALELHPVATGAQPRYLALPAGLAAGAARGCGRIGGAGGTRRAPVGCCRASPGARVADVGLVGRARARADAPNS